MQRVMLITNTGWSMLRHRGEQIRGLVNRGYLVAAVALYEKNEADEIRKLGAEPYRLSCAGAGANVIKNGIYFSKLASLIRRLEPDVVHSFSIKAGVWACLAARSAGVPSVVCTMTGGDYLVSGGSKRKKKILKVLAKWAFSGGVTVLFQNNDDLELCVRERIVSRKQCKYVPGCGVDVAAMEPNYAPDGPPTIVMVARMLWSKGVGDFVDAATIAKAYHPECKFLLVGGTKEDCPAQNSDFVPKEWLQHVSEGETVTWLGAVAPERAEQLMRDARAVVLPSRYAEGVPRVLIEAAALGKPIITTNMPGCRDVVRDGVSGFLCEWPRQIASAMCNLLDAPQRAAEMGRAGREISKRFDTSRFLDDTIAAYELSGGRPRSHFRLVRGDA